MSVRPAVLTIAVAALVAAVAWGCSSDSASVGTLVSREYRSYTSTCGGNDPDYFCLEFVSITMRDQQGAQVTVSELRTKNFLGPLLREPTECGGITFARPPSGSHQNRIETEDGALLRFEKGGSIRLVPEAGTFIPNACYDETGRWDGIDGPYANRTGTYRWIDDTLQNELTLTES